MRILYLYQYFKTREGYGSTRSYEFARRLQDAGHEVTVVTSTARIPHLTGERKGGLIHGAMEGIGVIAVPSSYSNRMGFARRLLEFLRFALLSSVAVLRAERPDLIFASSTPLTIAIPALAGRVFRRIPLVFEVRDLWPEVPAGMGILKNPLFVRLAKGLAGATYRRSARIVVLSPGMGEGVQRYGVPASRITVIPNGSDLDLFRPGAANGSALRARLGLGANDYLVVHTGAMGTVNGLDFMIPVCARLHERLPEALVVLIGEGGRRPGLERGAKEAGLTNLRFFDPVPKNAMPEWLAAADLGLMLIKRIPILEMNSANKFFDYAAAGLPCLMNYGGWKAALLARYDAGRAVETDDADTFARAIEEMLRDAVARERMGVNARAMAEAEFDRDKHFALLKDCLRGAMAGGKAA